MAKTSRACRTDTSRACRTDTSRACRGTTYILRCADNKLYVGSTTKIEERLKRHNAGYASEFTHLHKPVELVYKEEYDT